MLSFMAYSLLTVTGAIECAEQPVGVSVMKILIVEDEIKTGEYLSKGLTEAGFVVDRADNGLTGYHLADRL